MYILGIETSCDESAAAVVQDGTVILSSSVSSQIEIHHRYGGVVPELASRKHIEAIIPVVETAVNDSGIKTSQIDAVAATRGPGLVGALLVGFSFAMRPDEGFYIPCRHSYLGAPEQLNLQEVIDRLKPVFENPSIKKIGQNIKYDWIVLTRHGIHLQGVAFDTMLASYLINPSKRAHNLDQIALDFLDHKTITYEDIAGKGKKSVSFSEIPVDKAVPYACEDADITLMAYGVLKPEVEKLGLIDLLQNIEMP